MYIKAYRAADPEAVPVLVMATFDSMNDFYVAAFYNYPDSTKFVIVATGTTGEVEGEPLAVLVASPEHIITGYIDTYFDLPLDPDDFEEDEDIDLFPVKHDEPNDTKRRAALLARLRAISPTEWLLVHDADEYEGWIEQGFCEVQPPADIAEDDAVRVLAWGALPEDADTLMQRLGLSWSRTYHRRNRAQT